MKSLSPLPLVLALTALLGQNPLCAAQAYDAPASSTPTPEPTPGAEHNPPPRALEPRAAANSPSAEAEAAAAQRELDRWNSTIIQGVTTYYDPNTGAPGSVTADEKFALAPVLDVPPSASSTTPSPDSATPEATPSSFPWPSPLGNGAQALYLTRFDGGLVVPTRRPAYAQPYWFAAGNGSDATTRDRLFVQIEGNRTGQLLLWRDQTDGRGSLVPFSEKFGPELAPVQRWKFNALGHLVSAPDDVEPDWLLCYTRVPAPGGGGGWRDSYAIELRPEYKERKPATCEKMHIVKVPLPVGA
ncbi:MAG: hypothetical protein M1832_003707 [Thelocarpon impressellum]|nr:MAG: hypothetical protein M1832_003707 [Thelocarpon impressellum]